MLISNNLIGFGGRRSSNTDPNFANVVALLHMDGTDASTTFTDVKGKTFTASGNAQLDTAQSKFGVSSGLFDGTGDFVSSADNADFEFGSGDFTIELFARFNATSGNATLIGKLDSAATDYMSFGIVRSSTNLVFYASSSGGGFEIANGVTFATGLTTGVWYHIAVNRTGTAWRGYIDGVGTSLATSSASIVNSSFSLRLGGPSDNAAYNGWLDEVRLTKGVGRYPANFTPPSAAFPDA
jgi:hypothetical protein